MPPHLYNSDMDQSEYLRLWLECRTQYRKNTAALARVWRLAHPNADLPVAAPSTGAAVESGQSGNNALPRPPTNPPPANRPPAPAGKITTAAEVALAKVSGVFTWRDIGQHIQADHPKMPARRTTISQFLEKRAARGELVVVEKGGGRRPTKYQKEAEE